MAAPSMPPPWLLKPIRPTPVALDSPEYSVLAAMRIGNVTLSIPVLRVATATVAHMPISTENTTNPNAPPAMPQAAMTSARYLRFAT